MGTLKENEIKKAIKENKLEGAYLVCGDEGFLKRYYLDEIIKKVTGNLRDYNYVNLSVRDTELFEVSAYIENFPVMGGRKCIVLSDMEEKNLTGDMFKQLEDIISDIPEYTVFMLMIDNVEADLKKSAKWKKLIKLFDTNATVVELSKRTESSLVKMLCATAEKNGASISKDNAALLIKTVGNDMQILHNELEKLCLTVGDGEITKSDIENLTPKTLESSVFEISKNILKRNYDKAFEIIQSLLDRKEEPVAITAVLANAYIDLYRARVMLNCNGSRTEIMKAYKYSNEYRLKFAERDSANMTLSYLRECLGYLRETDMKLKSSTVNKRILLEELIVKLGTAGVRK